MRSISAALFMTIDGVVEEPYRWSQPYVTDDMTAQIDSALEDVDAVLIGRRTYEMFAKIWPTQSSEMPMADFLNHTHKYVVSSRLKKLEWGPATLIRGKDLRSEVVRLKEGPGKGIQVPGSPTLIKSLLSEGLLDQLTLSICPVGVGNGMRLFEDVSEPIALKLMDCKASPSGLVTVTYEKGEEAK